jgi:Na+/proline symporter
MPGPFWYAAGATVPLFAFAVIAFNVKARAPQAHTLLEVVRARWGYTAHKVFFFFAITTNVIVTAMELLGGASVLNALTGVNRNAACMLIPVGVIIKTVTGGLSQTYVSSLLGSWLIMIVVLVFAFRVYATGDDGLLLGSPAAVWDNLNTYASTPAPENPSQEVKDMKLGPISGASSCSHHRKKTPFSQNNLTSFQATSKVRT